MTPTVAIVFCTNAHYAALRRVLPEPWVRVTSRAQFTAAAAAVKGRAIGFVDIDLLYQVDEPRVPVVALVDEAPAEARAKILRSLGMFPWLEHVITSELLDSPALAAGHYETLHDRLAHGPACDMLGAPCVARVALLARASRREERFERMRKFLVKCGLSGSTIAAMSEISEELVTNALYDAPVEAGFFKHPIERTEDVELPHERACEISYGIEQDNPFVRVRDTFGAFTRPRLLEVLTRCNAGDGVSLDVSRGGAGLGMWRVFSAASKISINVVPGRMTDVLVGFTPGRRRGAKQLQALHLFFGRDTIDLLDSVAVDDNSDTFDRSFTLMLA